MPQNCWELLGRIEALCELSCGEDAQIDPDEALMEIWKITRLNHQPTPVQDKKEN